MPPCLALSTKGCRGRSSLRHHGIMSRGCTCTSSCFRLQEQEIGSWPMNRQVRLKPEIHHRTFAVFTDFSLTIIMAIRFWLVVQFVRQPTSGSWLTKMSLIMFINLGPYIDELSGQSLLLCYHQKSGCHDNSKIKTINCKSSVEYSKLELINRSILCPYWRNLVNGQSQTPGVHRVSSLIRIVCMCVYLLWFSVEVLRHSSSSCCRSTWLSLKDEW